MSQTSKIVLGIAVAVVVLAGAYYYWHQKQNEVGEKQGVGTNADVTTLPTGSSTTDASLNKDLSSIDAQIQAVSKDNVSASQSVDAAAQ